MNRRHRELKSEIAHYTKMLDESKTTRERRLYSNKLNFLKREVKEIEERYK